MNPLSQADFALQSIELGRAKLATDPDAGIFQIYTAHLLLAREAQRESDARCYEELRQAANIVRVGFVDYQVVPSPERQINCLILAAAVDDLPCATVIAAIEPNYSDSHRFDVTLNRLLRATVLHKDFSTSDYRPTAAEEDLFSAIRTVGTKSFSTVGTERYWRATRRKRYKYTIHEDRNLFPALQNLHRATRT